MKRIINIVIYGAGNWGGRLLQMLPTGVIVNAFIETKKSKESFKGIPVYSKDDFPSLYQSSDFVVIATKLHDEVIREIQSDSYSEYNRIFIAEEMCGLNEFYFTNKGVCYSLEQLFDAELIHKILESFISPYLCFSCEGLNFIVNSEYKEMIKELAGGHVYQQDDMDLFYSLLKQYYGLDGCESGYFFDIGANIGTSSVYLKKKCYPNMSIVAFEPVSENCKQIEINRVMNEIPKEECMIINAALSDKNSTAFCMLSNQGNLGDNRILINGNEVEGRDRVIVNTLRLDDWIDNQRLDAKDIKFIWMDVQAHEAFVILGGKETLLKYDIPVFMEFWPVELNNNSSLDMLIEELKKLYRWYICIEEYKNGKTDKKPIIDLKDLANRHQNDFVDILLIK